MPTSTHTTPPPLDILSLRLPNQRFWYHALLLHAPPDFPQEGLRDCQLNRRMGSEWSQSCREILRRRWAESSFRPMHVHCWPFSKALALFSAAKRPGSTHGIKWNRRRVILPCILCPQIWSTHPKDFLVCNFRSRFCCIDLACFGSICNPTGQGSWMQSTKTFLLT